MMTRIIDIADIITTLSSSQYSNTFNISIDNNTVLSTADFLRELEYAYHDMSYISHKAEAEDINVFIALWTVYKERHYDEWARIYRDVAKTQTADFDPMSTYKETKTVTPEITVTSDTDYGHIISTTSTGSNTMTYGKTTTDQTNTYDGTLRNSDKSTDSGSDTSSLTNTGSDTHSGKDSNTTVTTGSTTETKEGYTESPLIALQTDIDFAFKNNLRDLIINNFAREFLIYDCSGGGYHDCYYI